MAKPNDGSSRSLSRATKILFLALTTMVATVSAQAQGAPDGFPRLIWSDEFSSINTNNWTFETGNNQGWGNHEREFYTGRLANARIENGHLIIEARREDFGGFRYTSARMKTQGHHSFGINTWVEARINGPEGQGIWPAFWMLGNSIGSAGWPACGEIDIMEMRGQQPDRNVGTMHWQDGRGVHASFGGTFFANGSLTSGFHTYAISRTSTEIRWYVDRRLYATGNIANGINSTQEFQHDFFILFNVATGGDFVGGVNEGILPQRMEVDWVRVYGK